MLPAAVFFFEDGLKIYAAKSGLFLEVVVASLVENLVVGGGERQRSVLGDFQSSVVVEEEREKRRRESGADGRRRSCLMVF